MADDKRNRDQQQGGNESSTDRQRNKDRKPGSGSMESPESTGTRRKENEEPQE
jgi:hypothetical protein